MDNDMNDDFVEELLAQCVKLQRMGVKNREIAAALYSILATRSHSHNGMFTGANRIVIKGASSVGVGRVVRVGNDGHVVRTIMVYDEAGRILHEVVVMSRDGILPVEIAPAITVRTP